VQQKIVVKPVATEHAAEKLLAPNSNNHATVSIAFAWTGACVRSAGLHVARVVVSGLARVQPAAFPLDPGGRLARAAARFGWAGETECTPYPGW
jgi:hypothetical protein